MLPAPFVALEAELVGEAELKGTTKVYSVNRAQVIVLLNEYMNPYDLTVDDTTVTVPQVTEVANEVDPVTATLDTFLAVTEEEIEEDITEEGEE